jgi:hypothetical protein
LEKNKQSFILKQIIWGIAFIVPSVYLTYRGIIGINFLMILAGIILFVIGIGILRAAVDVIKGAELLSDDELDAGFADIRSYVRETLLPLGFEEENSDFYTTYKRGELIVQLANDKRDQEFSLLFATKSKSMSITDKKKHISFDMPDFEISVIFPFSNIEGFRMSVYEKLPQWLKEQNFK